MRKEARDTQMRDRASGIHPDILVIKSYTLKARRRDSSYFSSYSENLWFLYLVPHKSTIPFFFFFLMTKVPTFLEFILMGEEPVEDTGEGREDPQHLLVLC